MDGNPIHDFPFPMAGVCVAHRQCYPRPKVHVGLNIELQDEFGSRLDGVNDPKNLLGRLLPPIGDDAYPMLGSIDPYGDTIFNHVQMHRFFIEWPAVSGKAQTTEEQLLLSTIDSLARRCRDEVHLYLKFIGD